MSKISKVYDFSWIILERWLFLEVNNFFMYVFFAYICCYFDNYLVKLVIFAPNYWILNFFCGWYFLKPWSFCMRTLFFQQKTAKFKINCQIMKFSRGWFILNAWFFTQVRYHFFENLYNLWFLPTASFKTHVFFFWVNALSFCLILAEICDFWNKLLEYENFPQLIFLNPQSFCINAV